MIEMRTCPNCGAPLRGDRCEYCGGTVDHKTPELVVFRSEHRVHDVMTEARVPMDQVVQLGPEAASQMLMSRMRRQLADYLGSCMVVRTEVDPLTGTYVSRGRIRVVDPEGL